MLIDKLTRTIVNVKTCLSQGTYSLFFSSFSSMQQIFAFYLADHLRVKNACLQLETNDHRATLSMCCEKHLQLRKKYSLTRWPLTLEKRPLWKMQAQVKPGHLSLPTPSKPVPVSCSGWGGWEHMQSPVSHQTWNKTFHVLYNHKRKILVVMRRTSKCKANLALNTRRY